MLYNVLKRMIENKNTTGLTEKLDVFFALNKLTKDEYDALTVLITGGSDV